MKKIVFILFALLILVHNIALASWAVKYDADIVYLSTECTNGEAATFTIAINEEECFMYLTFKSIMLTPAYTTKIECKFDDENTIIITAQSSERESIMFSDVRSDRYVARFIENLSNCSEFSIKIKNDEEEPCLFTFDMSGLKEQFQNISSSSQ